ncbi:formylglycine-generating enzyme family protein [Burkholderia anthina]|uniref:formylglycine-generating enzyme family protein n=1 Tax=Burkholderia anthina TaxID=179879 RepID=UPI0015883AB5|nr:formylglycine-generating enzyme family protein [Burkholderia anthina]
MKPRSQARRRPRSNLPAGAAHHASASSGPDHRTLLALDRRGLRLVIALVIACAAIGALVGWLLAEPSHAHAGPRVVIGDGRDGPRDMAWIPAGTFLMGSDAQAAQPNERPAHRTSVHGFWLDRQDVTNAEFRRFVDATGYVTTAERKPDWDALKAQLPPDTPRPPDSTLVPGALVFVGTAAPVSLDDYARWWRFRPGANWRHPDGPGSTIAGKDDYPVVQVSYDDARAYAKWVGKRLPTEAEWEFAARGGLEQADYAWGNQLKPSGRQMANIWEGQQPQPFPVVDARAGRPPAPSPAGTYPANGYGLYDMAGNVWQWVADWYRADAFLMAADSGRSSVDPPGPADSWDPTEPGVPPYAPKRVIRGGSFLCNEAYCQSYRPSARRGADPEAGMSHLGFRLAMDERTWRVRREAVHADAMAGD